jgi:hypothetical protein
MMFVFGRRRIRVSKVVRVARRNGRVRLLMSTAVRLLLSTAVRLLLRTAIRLLLSRAIRLLCSAVRLLLSTATCLRRRRRTEQRSIRWLRNK